MKAISEIRYLKRIEEIDTLIERIKEDKERWLDIATSITAPMGGERVQTSSNGKKMENAIINSMGYDDRIVQLNLERLEILKTIELLPFVEYNLLYMRYVKRMEYKDIAMMCNKSYSWATSVHGRALQSLKKILGEKKDEIHT